jgi:hypothetical protein
MHAVLSARVVPCQARARGTQGSVSLGAAVPCVLLRFLRCCCGSWAQAAQHLLAAVSVGLLACKALQRCPSMQQMWGGSSMCMKRVVGSVCRLSLVLSGGYRYVCAVQQHRFVVVGVDARANSYSGQSPALCAAAGLVQVAQLAARAAVLLCQVLARVCTTAAQHCCAGRRARSSCQAGM